MPARKRTKLEDGVYDEVVSRELARLIQEASDRGLLVEVGPLSGDELVTRLVAHFARELRPILKGRLEEVESVEEADSELGKQGERVGEPGAAVSGPWLVPFANDLLRRLDEWRDGPLAEATEIDPPPRLLEAVHTEPHPPERPSTPFTRGALLTASGQDPRLFSELTAEMATASDVDALVSFVKWRGYLLLQEPLERLSRRGVRLRFLTTVYTGASDATALVAIARIPGAEVKISYDVRRTRLHAKAWLFERPGLLSTAYVGSANISQAALGGGLEWTLKAAEAESPDVVAKFRAAFGALWEGEEFEKLDPENEGAVDRLGAALRQARFAGRERALLAMPGDDSMAGVVPSAFFALRPWPHQQEILDRLAYERRVLDKHRHLVVAATGTGKTLVAAFDYERLARERGVRPRLLFVAHREELLDQARKAYREVLRDGSFGEMLAGGEEPASYEHLFATIQSLGSRDLVGKLGAGYWDVVVVDEFHHAAAETYHRFLEAIAPLTLIGLTATPERSDQLDVLAWFGGEPSASIRLWEAIERGLIAPFEYFGLDDETDLKGVEWRRGGYDVAGLEKLFTGNDVRARLVADRFERIHGNPRGARALGFCVSVEHARFMARYFSEHGIPSLVVHGKSPAEARQAAPGLLRDRAVNVLFTCDLYNEGVDLPDVDTLLLLRPTESALLFQQQLGRGLRLAPGKTTTLVLDFIGQHRREFRFERSLGVLTGLGRGRLREDAERGFPLLPSGCSLHLEKKTREVILQNLRQALAGGAETLAAELRQASREGRCDLRGFLRESGRDLDDVYERNVGGWTALRRRAGVLERAVPPGEAELGGRFATLLHVDGPDRLVLWARIARGVVRSKADLDLLDQRRVDMLAMRLFAGNRTGSQTGSDPIAALEPFGDLRGELIELADVLRERVGSLSEETGLPESWALSLHRSYTRDEVLAAIGLPEQARSRHVQTGVVAIDEVKSELLFVTIQKDEKLFVPSARYLDHALGPRRFHWQSQARVAAGPGRAMRYSGEDGEGWRFFLFVRLVAKDEHGRGAAFTFLGEATHESSSGDRPISVVWNLRHAIPAGLLPLFSPLMAA